MKTNLNNKLFMGIITILVGLLLLSVQTIDRVIALFLVNFGTVVVISSLARNRKKSEALRDERTRKIAAKAAAYSWQITLMLIAVLVWIEHFQLIVLNVQAVLGLILFSLTTSFLIFRFIYSKKSDIE